jgi:hypothetical protein
VAFKDSEGDHYALFFIRADAITRTFGDLVAARTAAQARGDRRTASRIDVLTDRLNRDLRQVEVDIARIADERIRAKIRQSAKRPDSGGRSGNMAGNVRSEPLPSTPSIAGVGIARYDILDRTVNPDRKSKVPYWRTQEFGYVGHVGRELHGLFYGAHYLGGGRPATQAEFRRHPLFRASPKGPPMRIGRPIKARHFLRDGSLEAEAIWRRRVRAAELRFARSVQQVIAGQAVPLHPSRRPVVSSAGGSAAGATGRWPAAYPKRYG